MANNLTNNEEELLTFFDPHFHVWDASEGSSASGHDSKILFKPNGVPIYGSKEYESEFSVSEDQCKIVHKGGVFIEALSVCYPDSMKAGPELDALYRKELTWAKKTLVGDSKKVYVFVPSASLENANILEYIKELKETYLVRGIRQIVNFEPSWPRNKVLGNLFESQNFRHGFELLGLNGLSFDMQLNPNQYQQAIECMRAYPKTRVIINHMGTPTLEDLTDEGKKEIFWKGMKTFASLDNVFIKISMLCYIDPNWDENELVIQTVHKIIELFGCQRCALASNYPVDSKDGWGSSRLFNAFEKLTKEKYSAEERIMLYGGAAKLMYRVSP